MKNLLPYDGFAWYQSQAITHASAYLDRLLDEIPWQQERIRMFGREIAMRRMVSWHADEGLSYTYSGKVKEGLAWTPTLLDLRRQAEMLTGATFNSCLLNLYHDGRDAMGWHSDDERALGPDPVIASLSLGEPRKFGFRHKQSGERVDLLLEHGSLLLMGTGVQQNWKHALLPSAKATNPRVSLTFRRIFPELS